MRDLFELDVRWRAPQISQTYDRKKTNFISPIFLIMNFARSLVRGAFPLGHAWILSIRMVNKKAKGAR
jgi:hypothetical protein